jgi:hypothetical protein
LILNSRSTPLYFQPFPDGESGLSQHYFLGVDWRSPLGHRLSIFIAAVFLVSVPVFIEAPLVRFYPWLSLTLALLLFGLAAYLQHRSNSLQWQQWGDLLHGFAWTWLSGSIYWGWLRWEPLCHLPVEAIGLPFALWGLWQRRGLLGHCFYLGSLFGTAITDLYFYITDLIPAWRALMRVEPELAGSILQGALVQVYTPWGMAWAIALTLLLLAVSLLSLHRRQGHWWGFSGAVASTLLVDGLFWLVAAFA